MTPRRLFPVPTLKRIDLLTGTPGYHDIAAHAPR
jgi:hypothetical protein